MLNNTFNGARPNCTPVLPTAYSDSLSYYEELCKLSQRMTVIEQAIGDDMKSILDEYFNSFIVEAIYDAPTETITLKKELTVGDGVHTYSADTNSMTIGG